MNKQQKHLPKYWVLHNIEEDDIIIASAAKYRPTVVSFAEKMYGEDWILDESFVISLVEINLVEMEGEG